MADGIKISELPEIQTLQDGCCFPIISEVDGKLTNVKIKKVNLVKNLYFKDYTPGIEFDIGKWIDGKTIYRQTYLWEDIPKETRSENDPYAIIQNQYSYIDVNPYNYNNYCSFKGLGSNSILYGKNILNDVFGLHFTTVYQLRYVIDQVNNTISYFGPDYVIIEYTKNDEEI